MLWLLPWPISTAAASIPWQVWASSFCSTTPSVRPITLAAPASEGVTISTAASGTSTVANNKVRHCMARFLSDPVRKVAAAATGVSGAGVITFDEVQEAGSIVSGMAVYGTNVGSAAIVAGVIYGNYGIEGVNVSVVNSGTVAGTVTFSPRYELVSFGALDV
jgi:hypothetical protein